MTDSARHLVLLETSGNQAYIFASNRLRQNVGASELVLRAPTQWVLDAVRERTGRDLWSESTAERVTRLRDPRRNPRIEDGGPVEVVVATSARAILLTDSAATGRELVGRVTERALRDAPGLGVTGVVVPCPDRPAFPEALKTAGQVLLRMRSDLPSPEARFRRLPVVAACRTTGLPAGDYDRPTSKEEPEELSQVARRKLDAVHNTTTRMAREGLDRLTESLGTLESPDREWLAVIHADGNGMGRLFRDFAERIPAGGDAADTLRGPSTDVELASLAAFTEALERAAPGTGTIPLVPLVLGGDDLTVVCDGRLALDFTTHYLRAFGRHTSAIGSLTASAGIAVVKRHYPLHAAYDLADDLSASAKRAKRYERSAFDFHVLLDSSGADLDQIRQRRRSREAEAHQLALWGGPYVLDVQDGDAGWLAAHSFATLQTAMTQLSQRGAEGRRSFPGAAAHSLRSALFEGRDAADRELCRIEGRFTGDQRRALLTLGGGSASLVREEPEPPRGRPALSSAFVDAMDAADLWGAG